MKTKIYAYNFFITLSVLLCLTGIGLFCFQSYLFLKYGKWVDLPLTMIPQLLGNVWIDLPDNWLGLHKIIRAVLDFFSVPFVFTFGGGCLAGVLSNDKDEFCKQQNTE